MAAYTQATAETLAAGAAAQREKDSTNVALLLQGLRESINTRFNSIEEVLSKDRIKRAQNDVDIIDSFQNLQKRLEQVEQSRVEDWLSQVNRDLRLRGGAGSMGPPPNIPPSRNSPPRNSPPRGSPPRNEPAPPREGDISKFKPDITYDGKGDIDAFFFALKQGLQAYNLNTPINQLLAFGRSLREGALNWWRLSYNNYHTLQEAAAGLETAFRDKSVKNS